MDIPYRGRYDRATINQAVALTTRPARWANILRWALLIGYGLFFAYLALPRLANAGSAPVDWAPLTRPLLILVILLAFALSPYLNTFRLARGLWRKPSMQVDRSGTITAQGIVFRAHDGNRRLDWDQFTRRCQAPDLTVLVTTNGALTIFPRRFFAGDDAWRGFQQLLDQHLSIAK